MTILKLTKEKLEQQEKCSNHDLIKVKLNDKKIYLGKDREINIKIDTSKDEGRFEFKKNFVENMNNKELMFKLIKELEKGEMDIYIGEDWHDWDKSKGETGALYLIDKKSGEKILFS